MNVAWRSRARLYRPVSWRITIEGKISVLLDLVLRWAAKMSFFRGLWKSSSKHKSKLSLFCFVLFFFFFFFKVSRINRWIFIFRSFVSRFARTNVNTIGKFFFFFEGWLFEREKNTRFARFWNISDVSDEGYFFDMNKNWIYRWNGLLCKIEA